MAVGKTSATHELSLVMSRSAISVFTDGFTATGLVQASMQWTRNLARSAENPIDKRNSQRHHYGLVCMQANS
jgi:hypothetical protein